MNKTKIPWVKNPDGSQGYTWNPITGCLNGCSYCFARKLANTRLKATYLANTNLPSLTGSAEDDALFYKQYPYLKDYPDPFYPRFWSDRLNDIAINLTEQWDRNYKLHKKRGIFTCDMSDLFGIGVPEDWTRQVLKSIDKNGYDRFYLLTKQPQNLIKFSPFPDNCWVGVSATDAKSQDNACLYLRNIEAKLKFISFEPLLERINFTWFNVGKIGWVIIGAQTKPTVMPKIEWVREIVEACDKADIPVFIKNNLFPLFEKELQYLNQGWLRQEMPE